MILALQGASIVLIVVSWLAVGLWMVEPLYPSNARLFTFLGATVVMVFLILWLVEGVYNWV